MTAKDFIKNRLTKLWNRFPTVQFQYEFKTHTLTHVIEVIPLSIFEKNEGYMMLESDFEFEFEQLFPLEQILFVSEGSLTEIKNADFQLGPKKLNFKNEVANIISTFDGFEKAIDNSYNFALAA